MNNCTFIGRVVRKIELEQRGEAKYARLVLAVPREGKKDEADFPEFDLWNKTAENAYKYLDVGRQVGVRARFRTAKFTNKEGKTVYTSGFVADSVEFLGAGGTKNAGDARGNTADVSAPPVAESVNDDFARMADEDIPF